MSQLLPYPVFKGNPGDKLYTYYAGTSTPLSTYTDSSGGTANSNPVVLSADGIADVWWSSEAYKVKLYDKNDVLIWEVDEFTAASGSGYFTRDSSGGYLYPTTSTDKLLMGAPFIRSNVSQQITTDNDTLLETQYNDIVFVFNDVTGGSPSSYTVGMQAGLYNGQLVTIYVHALYAIEIDTNVSGSATIVLNRDSVLPLEDGETARFVWDAPNSKWYELVDRTIASPLIRITPQTGHVNASTAESNRIDVTDYDIIKLNPGSGTEYYALVNGVNNKVYYLSNPYSNSSAYVSDDFGNIITVPAYNMVTVIYDSAASGFVPCN